MISYKENLERAVNGFISQLRPDDQLITASFFQFAEVNPATKVSELRGEIKPKIKHETECLPKYLYDAVDNALNRMKKISGRKGDRSVLRWVLRC